MMFLLFPNQLFHKDVLASSIPAWKKKEYVIWEDPLFYGIRPDSPAYRGTLALNKLRIIYQKWLLTNYIEYLQNYGIHVAIIPFEDILSGKASLEDFKESRIECFDPEDNVLKARWKHLPIVWKDSPMFLYTSSQLDWYASTLPNTSKRLSHSHFYEFMKKNVLQELLGVKSIPSSTDKENRKPFPKRGEATLPELPYEGKTKRKEIPLSLQKAEEWCQSTFPNNPEPEDLKKALHSYLVYLPSNHKEAQAWWKEYTQTRFSLFAKYEDAMVSSQPVLYHSFTAMLLNFGLLTPLGMVKDVARIGIGKEEMKNSMEAFLRQVAGWREYSRFYYRVVSPDDYHKNVFKNKKRLDKDWYRCHVNTSSKMPILVQETVRDAWNMGYLHHIRRLMVVCNYMNLIDIHPEEAYRWMYEFSLDSWEWVMVFNVYSMGMWADGGKAMRKPYVSSSSYLLKMADMGKGEWSKDWDKLYQQFLHKNRGILQHTIYAYQLRTRKSVA